MRWLFCIFLILCIVFGIFAYDTYKVTDFADVENAKYDRYITAAYEEIEQSPLSGTLITFPYYTSPQGAQAYAQFYQTLVISDRYIYIIRFNNRLDLVQDYYTPFLDRKSLIIDFDLSSVVVEVLYKSPVSSVYNLASGPLDSGSIPYESYIQDGYRITGLSSIGNFVSSGNGLLDEELRKAYNYLFEYLDLAFLYNGTTELGSSPVNNLGPVFYRNYDLVDLTPGNGFQFVKNINFEVSQVGPSPPLPDSENIDGPLEFIGEYFVWVVKEIIYLFKVSGAFLRGVVL